jgi:hypothetical protein
MRPWALTMAATVVLTTASSRMSQACHSAALLLDVVGDLGGDGEQALGFAAEEDDAGAEGGELVGGAAADAGAAAGDDDDATGEQALAEHGAVGGHGGASYARGRGGKAW